jgi:transcription antitermination protein NusB
MQALYAYYKSDGEISTEDTEKELFFSINKTYDLYHYLLILLVDVAEYAQKRLELAQNKRLPTEQDLNPNTRFAENRIINQIRINKQLNIYVSDHKLSWTNYPELIKGIYDSILSSADYTEYMQKTSADYQLDKSYILKVYKNILATYEPLFQVLEEQSIFWNDEIEFVIGSIIKTLKKFSPENSENAELMPLFKNDDDKEFAKTIFRKTLSNKKEYQALIEKFSKNWDFERIAFVDILLLELAIAEVLECPSIPVKVTFNEYIELSKFYSTKRSNIFINGILDKIIEYLKSENMINKRGRGLIGEE